MGARRECRARTQQDPLGWDTQLRGATAGGAYVEAR
jgi:hypothetical protein